MKAKESQGKGNQSGGKEQVHSFPQVWGSGNEKQGKKREARKVVRAPP